MPTAIYGVSHYGDPTAVYGKAAPRTPMTPDNLSIYSMIAQDKTDLLAAIATVATLAAKYSANIPAGDKNTYTVIGQSRAGMDEVYLRSMIDNPTLVPNFVLMADVTVDRNFRKDVKDVVAPLQRIVEGLSDAETLANSDNFMAYSAYYNNVKAAAKRGVPGADTELAKIQPFFPSPRRQTTTTTTPPPNP